MQCLVRCRFYSFPGLLYNTGWEAYPANYQFSVPSFYCEWNASVLKRSVLYVKNIPLFLERVYVYNYDNQYYCIGLFQKSFVSLRIVEFPQGMGNYS